MGNPNGNKAVSVGAKDGQFGVVTIAVSKSRDGWLLLA